MSEMVCETRHDEIAVITIDNPPVNALGPGVPEAIQAAIERAAADPSVHAVVVMGAGRTFIAGADIREFAKVVSGEKPGRSLLPFLFAIEECAKPVIMAIHGQAFGGGLETAMAGHYRVIAADGQVGQPEVKLGIIPGGYATAAATGGGGEGAGNVRVRRTGAGGGRCGGGHCGPHRRR
jgi:3-hydroxyacyl-CoA dehydrogenase